MSTLTRQDCDFLIELLAMHETTSIVARSIFETGMQTHAAECDDPTCKAHRHYADKISDFTVKIERGILLRAKFLQIRDSIAADQLLAGVEKAGGA